MTLAALIRKRESAKVATATRSISTIDGKEMAGTVARIAAVAVANPQDQKTAGPPGNVHTSDTTTTFQWWLIHFSDREPVEVACYPAAIYADILAGRPDAIAAEPFEPIRRQPAAPLLPDNEAAIQAWLAHIGETNRDIIDSVFEQCRVDNDARDYFIHRVGEAQRYVDFDDDRRRCDQCANLTGRGLCLAARRGEIVASRTYEPVRDWLRRCEGYLPGPDDLDRRLGRERWPGLVRKGAVDAT